MGMERNKRNACIDRGREQHRTRSPFSWYVLCRWFAHWTGHAGWSAAATVWIHALSMGSVGATQHFYKHRSTARGLRSSALERETLVDFSVGNAARAALGVNWHGNFFFERSCAWAVEHTLCGRFAVGAFAYSLATPALELPCDPLEAPFFCTFYKSLLYSAHRAAGDSQ